MDLFKLINNSQKIIKAVNAEFFTPKVSPKTDIPQHFVGGGKKKKKYTQKKKVINKIKSKNYKSKTFRKNG